MFRLANAKVHFFLDTTAVGGLKKHSECSSALQTRTGTDPKHGTLGGGEG